MKLSIFNNNLFEAGTEFFNQLGIQLNSNTASSLGAKELLKDHYKDKGIFKAIDEAYFLGLVDDSVFDGNTPLLNKEKISLKEAEDRLTAEYNGLMVFAVRLKDSYSPTRGEIAELTRAFNRVSKSVPVVLLLKYGGLLSFAASERTKYKQAWREGEKIGKISLLKDINIAAPHTGHLKILEDLKVAPAVTDFNALYKQWQEVFNVQLLNKKFYQELANWYFWALQNVEFPEDAEKNKDVRNAISVIRMITLLIFIWFVKEKGLVPDDLFNEVKVREILVGADGVRPDSVVDTKAGACHAPLQKKHFTSYYKAILQNLFFATLNTEMNKDKPGSRKFRGKNKGDGRDQHYMIHNVFRYEDYFASPQDTLKKYFENIPFLNGGLFECLDKEISPTSGKDRPDIPTLEKGGKGGFSNKKIIRIDAFSDRKDNPLKVTDHLFFSPEQPVDLNEIYGTKNKTYKVRGLIDILDSYKFTVDENTPIEEEIALDPELLGKVFENLLASYNPETQTTARKQTGSFYTPREIVNYMVDESIIAYLLTALDNAPSAHSNVTPAPSAPPLKIRGGRGSYDEFLRHLVAYNDQPHEFTETEVDVLIAAINTLKALDPACGSGAFPMGMLHKLVYILGKLDPDNSKWREVQRQKAIKETEEDYMIGDKEEREKRLLDISDVFENNSSDYGRKLYLIENCIFGVDIQPIAVQIAKLRFFVSLIVDQRIDSKKENLGVRPLPNLETKFVAANTLIGIEKPEQLLLRNPEIDRKEKELKEVRERHFTARTPQTKEKYRKEDERLRSEISDLLKKDGFPRETTEKLAKWNPYDQNASADFFDSEWMFGVMDGFDVVIGNPPYLESRHPSFSEKLKNIYQAEIGKRWHDLSAYLTRGADLLIYFFESSLSFINNTGVIVFITQNSWLNTDYGKKFQFFLLKSTNVKAIIDSDYKYFDSKEGPNINTVISIFEGKKAQLQNKIIFARYHENFQEIPFSYLDIDKLAEYKYADTKEYKYSDDNLYAIKWGILLNSEDFVLNLIHVLKRRAFYIDKISGVDMKIGQGLNLSKEYIVTHEFVRNNSLSNAAIPFVTSDDGAPFVLKDTTHFIIDKNKLTKDENKFIASQKLKSFDPTSTDKIMPILFMPRGIGRHFCAMNIAPAFTASCVDIYDYNKSTTEEIKLNLWLFLNSSVLWLLREISGRKNLGGGMLKAEATDLKSFPLYMLFNKHNEIIEIYEALSKRHAKDTIEELFSAEHKQIDKLVFKHLGLSLDVQNKTIAYLEKIINERYAKSKS